MVFRINPVGSEVVCVVQKGLGQKRVIVRETNPKYWGETSPEGDRKGLKVRKKLLDDFKTNEGGKIIG